jgi:hypothetical protein
MYVRFSITREDIFANSRHVSTGRLLQLPALPIEESGGHTLSAELKEIEG